MKSYTDLEQSKKLAEILPLETADMFHFIHEVDTVGFGYKKEAAEFYSKTEFKYLPCWSLSALLELLKERIIFGGNSPEGWFCCYTIKNPTKTLTIYGDSLVDACVAMIEELHELNKLNIRNYGSNRLCNCDGMDECLPHKEKEAH